MPHLILEYSDNLIEKETLKDVFQTLHVYLSEALPSEIQSCKGRAIECPNFIVGDGRQSQAFAHLTVKVLPGRTQSHLKHISESLFNRLQLTLKRSRTELNLSLSVEIIELADTYTK